MIVGLVGEVLFSTKISATARELGLQTVMTRNVDQFKEAVHIHSPGLVVIDLNMKGDDPLEAVRFLREMDATNFGCSALKAVGFLSHVDTELQERAIREGLKNIFPRSQFSKNLPLILKGEGLT